MTFMKQTKEPVLERSSATEANLTTTTTAPRCHGCCNYSCCQRRNCMWDPGIRGRGPFRLEQRGLLLPRAETLISMVCTGSRRCSCWDETLLVRVASKLGGAYAQVCLLLWKGNSLDPGIAIGIARMEGFDEEKPKNLSKL